MRTRKFIRFIAGALTATIVASSLPLTVAFEGSSLSWPNLSNIKINFNNIVNADSNWVSSNGNWYYYVDGSPITGWKQINSVWYYFDTTGVMATGWKRVDNIWYYFETSGAMLKSTWKKLNGKWYHFAYNGAMDTGWRKISDVWYYFDTSGAMATGWKKVDNVWYYFETNGIMKTGWNKIDNIWYYFDYTGAMATGWKQINNTWYHFDSNGAMNTGWKKINNKWYYFYSSGAMATNIDIDGGHIDANGVWTQGASNETQIDLGYGMYFVIRDDDNNGTPETAHICGNPSTDWTFSLNDYEGQFTRVVFDCNITSIPNYWLRNNTFVTEVVLPNSVTSLGSGAFRGSAITKITIPGSVSSLGFYCFDGCSNLSQIIIEDSNVSLELLTDVFRNCTSLESIEIPSRVTYLQYPFNGCTSLREVVFLGANTEATYTFDSTIGRQITDITLSCSMRLPNYINSSRTNINIVHTGDNASCETCYPPIPGSIDATQYTYTFETFYDAYNEYIFVRTDNPDPNSFCFYDTDTRYLSGSKVIKPTNIRFVDINYENYDTGRFDGGYICEASYCDGGELHLYQDFITAPYSANNHILLDSGVTVNCPRLYNVYDLIRRDCIDPNASFEDNMASIQNYLNERAIYPLTLSDPNQPTSTPYIGLHAPFYSDQPILPLSNCYARTNDIKVFSFSAYPFILDSASFPSTMRVLATELAPNGSYVASSLMHSMFYYRTSSSSGLLGPYGGQGASADCTDTLQIPAAILFPSHVTVHFSQTSDIASLNWYSTNQLYWAAAIAQTNDQYNACTSSSIRTLVGTRGAWVRGISNVYFYMSPITADGVYNIWVDGRFIGRNGYFVPGTTFGDSGVTQNFMLSNQTYVNRYGRQFVGDVIYEYDSAHDAWVGYSAYYSNSTTSYYPNAHNIVTYDEIAIYSPNLIMTRAQVEAMDPDRNTNINPSSGYIFDGTVYPGTPF